MQFLNKDYCAYLHKCHRFLIVNIDLRRNRECTAKGSKGNDRAIGINIL